VRDGGRREPSAATDRTDAPLIEGKSPEGGASPSASLVLKPSSFLAELLGAGFKAVECCGLPAPPGGWLGPFGFFRLVTYAFLTGAVFAVLLAVAASTGQPKIPLLVGGADGFAAFASLLLCFACLISAGAAYAHEGLEQEVTAMKKQNDLFKEKNDMLSTQLDELSGVRTKLEDVQKKMGANLDQFEEMLQELHTVSCAEILQLMLEAFLNSDVDGPRDGRLVGEEVQRFFDVCEANLKQAAPDFNVEQLVNEVCETGIGICNLRFLANAAVTGCDKVPGRSTAMLALVMFSSHPEKYEHELAISLKSVLGSSDEEIATLLQEKKAKADPKDGRIHGSELMDVSRRVMSASLEKPKEEV